MNVFKFEKVWYTDYMYEIRVESSFSAAHFLKDYHGKCENLHGHNYKVYAHVRGNGLDDGGMLIDFSELKKVLKEVCDKLDHTNLNDTPEFKQNPSAERIAKYIYDKVLEKMPELSAVENKLSTEAGCCASRALLYAIDVFETESNRARYLTEVTQA